MQKRKLKKADKLLKLTVDTGIDTRTVVSGIAEHYKPEEVVGHKVGVFEFGTKKIRGVESQGMILMAENKKALKLAFVSPTKEIRQEIHRIIISFCSHSSTG